MNTCETCKWWDTDSHWPNDLGKSTKHACGSPKLTSDSYNNGEYNSSDSLVYEYDEGGDFYSGPNFGCVHHEPKP
jgi:hypothetical protein